MLFWLSLGAAAALAGGGLAFAIVRGIALYRGVKRTGAELSARIERIGRTAALVERHLAAAQASGGRLSGSAARLRASQAQLAVQLAAVREARGQIRRMLWFVPGI